MSSKQIATVIEVLWIRIQLDLELSGQVGFGIFVPDPDLTFDKKTCNTIRFRLHTVSTSV
jgi:hypothetical protein